MPSEKTITGIDCAPPLLTDEEINQAIDRVVVELGNKFKAELRG